MITKIKTLKVMAFGLILATPSTVAASANIIKKFPLSTTGASDLEAVGQIVVTVRPQTTVEFAVRNLTQPNLPFRRAVLDLFHTDSRLLLGESKYSDSDGNAHVVDPMPPADHDNTVTVILRAAYDPSNTNPLLGVPLAMRENGGNWKDLGVFDLKPGPHVTMQSPLLPYNHFNIYTVEEPVGEGGTDDTVLMVLTANDDVITFDDDDGVEKMSFINLSVGPDSAGICTIPDFQNTQRAFDCSNWVILPTRRSNAMTKSDPNTQKDPTTGSCSNSLTPKPGTTTLIWQDHQPGPYQDGTDTDHDGLSDELEAVIHTDPYKADTDGDGIEDGWEVFGMYSFFSSTPKDFCARNLWKFPYYGADPLKQDLFVQVSWWKNNSSPWTSAVAKKYIEMLQPDLRAHVDIGAGMGTEANNYNYGNWGGAAEFDAPTSDFRSNLWEYCGTDEKTAKDKGGLTSYVACQGLGTPVLRYDEKKKKDVCALEGPRVGLFAPMMVFNNNEVQWNSGICLKMANDGGVAAHETGHFLGLGHGGPDGMTCKANYFSVLSYCGGGDLLGGGSSSLFPPFSHGLFTKKGRYGLRGLNTAGLDERNGLFVGKSPTASSALDQTVLQYIQKTFMRKVDMDPSSSTYGAVDWNDNGSFDSGLVPALMHGNRQGPNQNDKNQPWNGDPFFTTANYVPFVLRTVMAISPLDSDPGYKVYWANWNTVSSKTEFGTEDCGDTCSISGTAYSGLMVDKKVAALAVAADVMIFGTDADELWWAKKLDTSVATEKLGTNLIGPPVAIIGPATGIGTDGRIRVYAAQSVTVTGGQKRTALVAWDIDVSSATPKQIKAQTNIRQYWSTGDEVNLPDGGAIGLAVGYRSDTSGQQLFAAIPSLNPSTGVVELKLAMLKEEEKPAARGSGKVVVDRWEEIPGAFANIGPKAAGPGLVGLAYKPDDPATPAVGRFYVTWQVGSEPEISLTRGNELYSSDSTCSEGLSLCFPSHGRFACGGCDWRGGVSLLYAKGHVRGITGANNPEIRGQPENKGEQGKVEVRYFPNADGVPDFDMRDYNDFKHISNKLACAVQGCEELRSDYSDPWWGPSFNQSSGFSTCEQACSSIGETCRAKGCSVESSGPRYTVAGWNASSSGDSEAITGPDSIEASACDAGLSWSGGGVKRCCCTDPQ